MAFQCGATHCGWEWVTGANRLPAGVEATAAWVPGDCSFPLLQISLCFESFDFEGPKLFAVF